MKRIAQFLGLICLAVMVFPLLISSYASAKTSVENNTVDLSQDSADRFVKDQIFCVITEASSDYSRIEDVCTWSEETELGTPVVLYDPYDICNGYVYKLYTDGSETGYIQINCFDGRFGVYCYSFTGIPAYEGLSRNYEDELAASELTASKDGRLYFFGNMSYCEKSKDNAFRPLGSIETFSIEDAKMGYDAFLNAIKEKGAAEQLEDDRIAVRNEVKYAPQIRTFTLVIAALCIVIVAAIVLLIAYLIYKRPKT